MKKSFILVSHWNIVDFLKELKSTQTLGDTVAILSEPEPENEEASDYTTFANWMSRRGIQHYRLRVSGRYYPYEIGKIKEILDPKRIIPIHTESPELTQHFWKKGQHR